MCLPVEAPLSSDSGGTAWGHKEGHVSAEPTDKAGAVAGAQGGAAVPQTYCTQTLTTSHMATRSGAD